MKNFLLLDLERSVKTGFLFYWKGNRHGYTDEITAAGRFPEEEAKRICAADKDNFTLMISAAAADRLLDKFF